MAKPALFVGVDGGATKTSVRVENDRGRLMGEARSGPATLQLPVERIWQSIHEALAQIGVDVEATTSYCGAGLAGTELPGASDAFASFPHPFARLIVCSDGYIACLGAHAGADGAVIAIGTGVVGFRIEGTSETKIGGWGFPHGDEGSGAWLGLEAVRKTLHWLDGRAAPSPLLEDVYARFDHRLERLVAWATSAAPAELARIAPLVIEHVDRGTLLAISLMREAAAQVDRIGEALLAGSRAEALPCALLGGMAPHIEPWLSAPLRARLVRPRLDALGGALLMIRRAVAEEIRRAPYDSYR